MAACSVSRPFLTLFSSSCSCLTASLCRPSSSLHGVTMSAVQKGAVVYGLMDLKMSAGAMQYH